MSATVLKKVKDKTGPKKGVRVCRVKTGLEKRMKVSYEEGLANHFGLQRRGESGDRSVLSVRAKGNAGQPLSSEITTSVCRSCLDQEKATSLRPRLARPRRTRRSQRTGACVDIPNARTGRSLWFPLAMRNDDSRQWNGQHTSPTPRLT